jgi:hypothetical protein
MKGLKIRNSAQVSNEIEQIVANYKLSYIDAIVFHCEKNDIEIETIAKLLNTQIKQKIEIEAQGLNFIPKAENKIM